MSRQILKVNVSLQSLSQPQLCGQMLELMTREDRDGLLIVTSTQRISVSSKLLQIFSPLYRDMLRDIPSSDDPVTMFLPDYEAVHVHHLLDLLTSGRIKDKDLPLGSAGDILTLAKCFKIDLRESDLIVSLEDMCENPPPRIKVKNIRDMVSSVPCESLNKEKSKEFNGLDVHELINVEDVRDVQDDNKNKCTFCLRIIGGGKKSLKNHEKNQCRERPDVNKSDNELPKPGNECSICHKKVKTKSLKSHEKRCNRVYGELVLFRGSFDCPECSIPLKGLGGLGSLCDEAFGRSTPVQMYHLWHEVSQTTRA